MAVKTKHTQTTSRGRFPRTQTTSSAQSAKRFGRSKPQQSQAQQIMSALQQQVVQSGKGKSKSKARAGRGKNAGGMALLAGAAGFAMKNRSKITSMIGKRKGSGPQGPAPV